MSVSIRSIQRARHCRALSKDRAENAGRPGVESGPSYPAPLLPTSAGMILSGNGPRGYPLLAVHLRQRAMGVHHLAHHLIHEFLVLRNPLLLLFHRHACARSCGLHLAH